MITIWEDVFDHKWFCKVDRISTNTGILVVHHFPIYSYQDQSIEHRSLITTVNLAYGTGDYADGHDILVWKQVILDFIEQKGEFALQ